MKRIYVIGALALMFGACRPNVSVTTPPSAGPTVNFSYYLAIGDGYTEGITDGSLTVTGQYNSYPIRLFEQFSQIADPKGAKGPFVQPYIESDNGFPGPKKVLGLLRSSCNPLDSFLGPVNYPNFLADANDAKPFVSPAASGQINNIGVNGIRVVDYPVAGWAAGAAGPVLPDASRFYFNPSKSPLDELSHVVTTLAPTFITMWLGSNDVLFYALGGGQGDGTGHTSPTSAGVYNSRDISPTGAFDTAYDQALNAAIQLGASGALINVPDITALPFFSTIPINGLMLTQGQADTLQTLYHATGFNFVFQPGANLFIIQDHEGHTRQAAPGEQILLSVPRDSIKCAGWGSIKPIPDSFVLTTDEQQNIRKAVADYNSFIQFEAKRHNLAYVDINSFFTRISTGYTYNGINYTTQYIAGGAFSLDGITFTQRGYALIANEIIKTVNQHYGSTINPVDVNKYNGIKFP